MYTMLSMAIPERPKGWHVIDSHQPEPPTNPTAAFLNNLDNRLARAFTLTSADIEDLGHPVATFAQWLIQKSIAINGLERRDAVNLIRQNKEVRVPHALEVEYIFDVAQYTTGIGEGYYVFGYYRNPGEYLDESKRFIMRRVGKIYGEEEWGDEYINPSAAAGQEFSRIAHSWATSFRHFRVTVREGDNLDPQGGQPMIWQKAA